MARECLVGEGQLVVLLQNTGDCVICFLMENGKKLNNFVVNGKKDKINGRYVKTF
jgi:hypothetical protein